jgi:hypothetical protein
LISAKQLFPRVVKTQKIPLPAPLREIILSGGKAFALSDDAQGKIVFSWESHPGSDTLRKLYIIAVAFVLVLLSIAAFFALGGYSHSYQYSGTLQTAEHAIANKGFGLVLLLPEAQGDAWIRYRVVHDTSGIYITNGIVKVTVESGRVWIRGPADLRTSIKEALG